jgi:alpha-tubulin suppressor-like RCC1 family protein
MSPSLTPIGVTGLSAGVTGIAAGGSHTCALPPSSFPVCWGDGVRGDLGNGATAQSSVPVTVSE